MSTMNTRNGLLRVQRSRVAIAATSALSLAACGASRPATAGATPPSADVTIRESTRYAGGDVVTSTAAPVTPTNAMAMPQSTGGGSGEERAEASSASSPPPPPAPPSANTPREMLEVEARVTLEVDKVSDATERVRALVREQGGQVINESVSTDHKHATAQLALRVPSEKTETFMTALAGLGIVRSKQVTARDVGKEYFDAQIVLANLEATLHRYEEILAKATEVKQILEIESELSRVRTQIDRVKGDMRYMRDRTSRSTIYLSIATSRPDAEETFAPEAKLYPGLRATMIDDLRGGALGSQTYFGMGVSFMFARWFSFDVDFLDRNGKFTSNLDALLLTAGGEFYSDFLGGGKRRFLNPYIGFRAGYTYFLKQSEMLLGGTVGLELYRDKSLLIDVQSRFYASFNDVNVHAVVQPTLGINISF